MRRFAATVTREESRVQMIKIQEKRVLVARREGSFPAPSAAVVG